MSKQTHKKISKTEAPKRPDAKTPGAAKASAAATSAKPAAKPAAKAGARPAKKAAKAVTVAAKPSAPMTGAAAALAEGAPAPAFQLRRDGGEMAKLADYSGKKLVIFFYPRANTPGCTREAIDFTRLAGDFAKARTSVIGVSADSLKAQESFRDKHQLGVPLLSDEQHSMLEAYGAWGEKSLYGRKFLGIFRMTVLIGSDGRIARIWRNVKVDGHAEQVLAAAKTL